MDKSQTHEVKKKEVSNRRICTVCFYLYKVQKEANLKNNIDSVGCIPR